MFCPACQQSLVETAAACAACGFSLEACDTAFGAPPALTHPVTDPNHHLSRIGRAQVSRAAADLNRRFPQITLSLLLLPKPPAAPIQPWLFWLFNRGGLQSALEKSGACRRFLLWIDPATHALAATCGYGLEPLLPVETLQQSLQAAAEHAVSGNHARAAVTFAHEIQDRLTRLHQTMPQTFGWVEERLWVALEATHPTEQGADSSEAAFAY